jgi:predicted permease
MWTRLVAFLSRLGFLPARQRLDDEAAEELETHLELLTARYVKTGMPSDEAAREARRQLGNPTLVREDIYRMNGISWLDALASDFRYAVRMLRRQPAFCAVAIATLGLGIGANTAIVSVVYSVLLRPLPYQHPDRLYSAEIVVPERRQQFPSIPASIQTFIRWRETPTDFADIAALRPWECNLTGDGEPERAGGARVSANFFSLLGVPMARGRTFAIDEEQPGREGVVVISDGLWRRRYAADPGLVGRTILINGTRHVVIGIAPASLLVPTGGLFHPLVPFAPRVDIFKPIAPTPRELEDESWDHGVIVRLADGGSAEQGRQQLATALRGLVREQAPEMKTAVDVQIVPMREIYAGQIRLRLLLVLAAAALLLLTACVSLANLLIARVASRSTEFATRIALGASRMRVMSLALAEALVLTLSGGGLGILLARYGVAALTSYGPDVLSSMTEVRPILPLLVVAIVTSVVTGVACGLFPAWQASRRDVADLLESGRGSTGGSRAGRARRALVGVEMGLATALLASAALLLHSFVNVMHADRGYEVERILTAELSLFGQRYDASSSRATFYGELVENVRALPGVQAAGAISDLPAVAGGTGASRTIFYPTDSDLPRLVLLRPVAMIRAVTPGYFAASGTTIRAGRLLRDVEASLTAVISRSLAHRLWPREPLTSVVGRQFRQGDVVGPLITVVGVVEDTQPGAVNREAPPVIYRPYEQWASGHMTLLVRTTQDPAALSASVRAAIRSLDSGLPILTLRTMREVIASTVLERQFQMVLTSIFALVALIVGAVGLYGVVSYAVTCRTREIGLRLALGAPAGEVMRWVFSHGMPPVLIGLAAGLATAVSAATALKALLFGIAPTDPIALGLVVLVLLTVAALACYLPARRAASLDPIAALRHD